MATQTDYNNYRSIVKRISAFGGVQLFNVLISLVRGKFVAMLLGPEGMGISTLYASSTATLQQLCGLGLDQAIVKEMAASREDPERHRQVAQLCVRLILLTAMAGGIVCALASPLLSLWTFGTSDYTLPFMALGLSVAFSIGGTGYLAMLQGRGEVKRLSKASLVGGLAGLCFGVPLYALFGTGGIVPAIIILSVTMFLFYFLTFRKSIGKERGEFTWKAQKPLAWRLVSLGLILMSGTLVGSATGYAINLFVRTVGSVADVGLYQAANSLTGQYVGIVFTALAWDYYPRLSAIAGDPRKLREVVCRQTEIVMLIITPLVIALIVTAPWLIRLLLTEEYLAVVPLLRWLGAGLTLQAAAVPLGYIYVAKEDRKMYVWLEVVWSNIYWIATSVVFYHLYSLEGLGIGYLVRALTDYIINYMACRGRYGLRYEKSLVVLITVSAAAVGIVLSLTMIPPGAMATVTSVLILTASAGYSAVRLRKGIQTKR